MLAYIYYRPLHVYGKILLVVSKMLVLISETFGVLMLCLSLTTLPHYLSTGHDLHEIISMPPPSTSPIGVRRASSGPSLSSSTETLISKKITPTKGNMSAVKHKSSPSLNEPKADTDFFSSFGVN